MSARIQFLCTAILCGLCAVALAAPPATNTQERFDAFVEHVAADWVRADPVEATDSQYFSGAEQDALDRRLTAKDFQYGIPLSSAARADYVARARRALAELRHYPRAELTPVERVSAASLEWQLDNDVRMAAVEDERYVFEQFGGLQVRLVNFLSQTHPVRNARDVDNYLARLTQVAPVLDAGIAEARRRAKEGVVPPKFILQASSNGLDRLLAGAPEANVLVSSLAERAGKLTDLSEAQRAQALAAATATVRDSVLPALRRVRALLTEQTAVASDAAGMWHLPQGSAAYAVMLRANTTTDMTPAQVYALGLSEVARIETEMDVLLRELGYTQGSVAKRYAALEASVQPPAEPDPRPGLIAEYTRILKDAQQRAGALFDLQPRASVQILREPAFTEKTAAPHYNTPAPDGSRPGTVWFPLPGPPYLILEMRSRTYHEGVPGHHFQLAVQQELPDLPKFRQKRVFGPLSAYTEGWGLYAEHLAAEAGWYEGDTRGRLGQLADELFRARRLVVDTGLHVEHWTRQQAIDYGIPAAEVDRYVAMPGQACSYKIGELAILSDRAKAQKALGTGFSLKQFHDWVLRTGAVPLSVLSGVIDEEITSSLAHPAPASQRDTP
jgi:uncharacterized protein (DUF885 family)